MDRIEEIQFRLDRVDHVTESVFFGERELKVIHQLRSDVRYLLEKVRECQEGKKST